MPKTLLIHGYATGLNIPPIRPALGDDAGFSAFRMQIASGEVVVFRWDIKRIVAGPEAAQIRPYLRLYDEERVLLSKPETHERLAEAISMQAPEVIVCHSMGCALLWEHMRQYSLPASVTRIIFTQADLPLNPGPLSNEMIESFRSGTRLLMNCFCPWDPTLFIGAAYHHAWRAGLFGLRVPYVQNVLFPLWRPWNLHTSSIRDPLFLKKALRP